MPKNSLSDLNDHLFMALERLNDESMTDERIAAEVTRAEAVSVLADKIIANAKVNIDALKLVAHGEISIGDLPASFQVKQLKQG